MQTRLAQYVMLLCGFSMPLFFTAPAGAQMANWRPSEWGPSQVLTNTLNRVGGGRQAAGWTLGSLNRPSAADVASVASPPGINTLGSTAFRRPGRGGVGYSSAYTPLRSSGTSLLGRRYGDGGGVGLASGRWG